ncbi:sugar phosphate isomerase/epimerase family protein [Cumulibacter manganitolerans]|uniref:sugar phosphate isomerase/epimerase family protein n=1 Tax=Cumulibacter manganitolerans TaxID=1884992 RepID=UPI0012970F6C|nr:sugar phosphate isomerase/epimerase [Cumulibacter manganitolerans]
MRTAKPRRRVLLSSASVFPEPLDAAFELAHELGYDGLEVMIWGDPASQDAAAIAELIQVAQLPVGSVHAPCLLITARVWGTEPGPKLTKSVRLAHQIGARTVVVHPPFRWQSRYAREFAAGVRALERQSGRVIAVENMFPARVGARGVSAYAPHWDVTRGPFEHLTLDTSHTSVARCDSAEMLARMGERLAHVHLADGTGKGTDEHLVPGRGSSGCDRVLHALPASFTGDVVVEVSTRNLDRERRAADLAEALRFARTHLAAPPPS